MREKRYALHALNIVREEAFVEFDDPAIESQMSSPPLQETRILKKEEYRELSKEAKQVIDLVLNTPTVLLVYLITRKYGVLSTKRLRRFLRKRNGWTKEKTRAVLSELKDYINEI